MIKNIRRWLQQLLFSTENLELEARLQALKTMREGTNITALVREQLAGFDSSLLSSEKEILEELGSDTEAINTFLSQVKELYDNPARIVIQNYLIRNQMLYGMMKAENLTALNFSRATINGITLFEEELGSLYGKYKELHKPQEDYDAHGVV